MEDSSSSSSSLSDTDSLTATKKRAADLLGTRTDDHNGDLSDVVNPWVSDVQISEPAPYHNRRCPCVQKPEGRDAWIAAGASVFITFCLALEFGAFGIYYQEYVNMFDASAGAVGFIKGLQTLAGGTVGLVSSVLIKVYGARLMGFVAGILLMLGYLGASLSPNIYVSYLFHGAVAGIGVNIALTMVLICIQQHFTRNGVLGAGISFFGFAVGTVSSPIVASCLIEAYGTRGALLLHSAVFANISLFSLFIRPPKSRRRGTPLGQTIASAPVGVQLRRELCDFSLLKDMLFWAILFTGFCAWYTTTTYMSHLAPRAMHYGIPRSQAAFLQSSTGYFNIVGRLVATPVANIQSVNISVFYGFTLLFVGGGPFVYSFLTSYNTMFFAPVLFGMGMGSSTTVYIVVLVKMFTVERLPRALGLYNMATHLGMTFGPPISGLIFDSSGNYDIPFILAGALSLFSSLVIFVVAFFDKRRQDSGNIKKLEQTDE